MFCMKTGRLHVHVPFFFNLVQIIENDDCVLKMFYSIFVKRLISPAKIGLHLLRKNYLKIVLNLSGMNKCNVQ